MLQKLREIVESSEEYIRSVPVIGKTWYRRLLAFIGPAYLVSVGYMDPGNWATDIEGGSQFGYTLLWVLLVTNLMAIVFQSLAARLGIVTGYDLAQACRQYYPRFVSFPLWILAEIAIAATDLAEVLGVVVALNMLFGIPYLVGTIITLFDTVLLFLVMKFGIRKLEGLITAMVGIVGLCFVAELVLIKPPITEIAGGYIPSFNPEAIYIIAGILGAVVMPHNIYLHSSLVQTRDIGKDARSKLGAIKMNLVDTVIALTFAFIINSAIMIVGAEVFHKAGVSVETLDEAHHLLEILLGTSLASTIFALALLVAGQSSTLTGTLSGQIVMEGFLRMKLPPWLRRLITRALAITPAIIAIWLTGEKGIYKLLILSQVILSIQLPFAVVPLLRFNMSRQIMKGLRPSPLWMYLGGIMTAAIILVNVWMLSRELGSLFLVDWLLPFMVLTSAILIALLGYCAFGPLRIEKEKEIMFSGIPAVFPREITRIGVAVEHSPGDELLIGTAISFAKKFNASVHVIHVCNTPTTMVLGKVSFTRHVKEDEEYMKHIASILARTDIDFHTSLRHGDPSTEIIAFVEEEAIDMLIVGSHGHYGLGDIIFGETVRKVRHKISIPVLIVRTSGQVERP